MKKFDIICKIDTYINIFDGRDSPKTKVCKKPNNTVPNPST